MPWNQALAGQWHGEGTSIFLLVCSFGRARANFWIDAVGTFLFHLEAYVCQVIT